MTNTFEQIKNNIISEFSNYKIEDIEYNNYDLSYIINRMKILNEKQNERN